MRRRAGCAAGLSFCLSLLGCGFGAFNATTPIESMTLFSLDGTFLDPVGPGEVKKKAPGETFHQYPVLGKVDIASPDDRLAILKAVQKGMADNQNTSGACFWPRHGIRFTQGGKKIEMVICFQCLQLDEYINGDLSHHLTTESPAAVLDKHLKAAGVPQQKPF